MVNIKACIEALKATWMRRLLTMDSKWQVFIKYYIQTENITGCGIKYLEEKMINLLNTFNKKIILTEGEILKSPLYYNDNIKIGGQHIYLKTWFKKSVRYINDLVNENGRLYEQVEFTQKTGIQTNFIQYNGLIQSIKQYLKQTKKKKLVTKSHHPLSLHILKLY